MPAIDVWAFGCTLFEAATGGSILFDFREEATWESSINAIKSYGRWVSRQERDASAIAFWVRKKSLAADRWHVVETMCTWRACDRHLFPSLQSGQA